MLINVESCLSEHRGNPKLSWFIFRIIYPLNQPLRLCRMFWDIVFPSLSPLWLAISPLSHIKYAPSDSQTEAFTGKSSNSTGGCRIASESGTGGAWKSSMGSLKTWKMQGSVKGCELVKTSVNRGCNNIMGIFQGNIMEYHGVSNHRDI